MRQSAFDLVLLYVIGMVGVLMRRFDFPTAPVIVGMILGPMAEAQMRNALSIGEGHWSVLVERPLSATIFAICALVLLLPPASRWIQRRRAWRAARA
jgi:putative tricarboxylic transport membrane protein